MKTRNLSASEYFMEIQREYLIADFRKKISFSPKDKRFFQKVCDFKAIKINDIATRNHLKSILNDNSMMEEVRVQLFGTDGIPRFELSETDIQNYYSIGNDFAYDGKIYSLCSIEGNELTLFSKFGGDSQTVPRERACRIL